MLSLQVFHKMKWLDENGNESEQVKIYGIFGILIDYYNKLEQICDEQDKQLANIKKQILTKEDIIKLIVEHTV